MSDIESVSKKWFNAILAKVRAASVSPAVFASEFASSFQAGSPKAKFLARQLAEFVVPAEPSKNITVEDFELFNARFGPFGLLLTKSAESLFDNVSDEYPKLARYFGGNMSRDDVNTCLLKNPGHFVIRFSAKLKPGESCVSYSEADGTTIRHVPIYNLNIGTTIGYALENKADAETHSSLTKLIARHSEKLRIPTSPASLQQAVDTFYNALVDEAKTKAAAKQAPAPATHSQSRYAETPEDDDEGTTTTSTSATGAVHQSSGYGEYADDEEDAGTTTTAATTTTAHPAPGGNRYGEANDDEYDDEADGTDPSHNYIGGGGYSSVVDDDDDE